jgi:prepilin-type processing-associated H-X9-DG protein
LPLQWSSFGAYMAAPGRRSGWMRVDRLLGGYHHGRAYWLGKANLAWMDGHLSSFTRQQTNGIIMEFKR